MEFRKLLLIIAILLTVSMTGLTELPFDLTNYVIPDYALTSFLETVEVLDTPELICLYMEIGFEYESHSVSYSPYQMWIANFLKPVNKEVTGDCNDYATFAIWLAHYHKYEVYQIIIDFYDSESCHMLGVFKEEKGFSYVSVWSYYNIQAKTFKEIVNHHCLINKRKLKTYLVINYEDYIMEYFVVGQEKEIKCKIKLLRETN